MQINLVCCMFVLDSQKNNNIRKNDIKSLKILVSKNNELPKLKVKENNIKNNLKNALASIIGSNIFHLEQVYTMDNENSIDIIYLAITNIENIKNINSNYKLVDFSLKNNNTIMFNKSLYNYKTVEKEENNNIEYIHDIEVKDDNLKNILLYLLISYKKIRSNIDNTDIIFKFMGDLFTLEDVRTVYEIIKDSTVDKSNFRKKIVKYCEKVESTESIEKNGYRPSQKYKFKPLKGDNWV